jgi:hypothetical protein
MDIEDERGGRDIVGGEVGQVPVLEFELVRRIAQFPMDDIERSSDDAIRMAGS